MQGSAYAPLPPFRVALSGLGARPGIESNERVELRDAIASFAVIETVAVSCVSLIVTVAVLFGLVAMLICGSPLVTLPKVTMTVSSPSTNVSANNVTLIVADNVLAGTVTLPDNVV